MEIEDFTCSICKSFYNEKINVPRLLMKCGHTFCEDCIKKKYIDDDNKLICPDDNTLYDNINNVEELPKNLSLLNIIKKAKARNEYMSLNQSKQSGCNSNHEVIINNSSNNLNNNSSNSNTLKIFTPYENASSDLSFFSLGNNLTNLMNFNNTENKIANYDKMLLTNVKNSEKNNTIPHENNSISNRNFINIDSVTPNVNEFNLDVNKFEDNKNDKAAINIQNNCPMHNRRREIVCVEDRVKICTSCALFGDHKNHNLKTEEDLLKELFIKSEILIEYFDIIDTFSEKLIVYDNDQNNPLIEKIKKNSIDKQNELCENVTCFFKEMRFLLKEREKQVKRQISQGIEEKVLKKLNNFEHDRNKLKDEIFRWRKK